MRVASDGAVVVREKLTFDYLGPFSGAFREIPVRAGERIDRIAVREGGVDYRPGGSLTLGTDGPPSQFGAGMVDGKMRIVWRYRAADERRTYTIRYRLSGLARAYDDVVDVNLQVWGGEWKVGLGRLQASMAAPGPVGAANARIYGHPVDVRGDTAFGGGIARLRALDVPAHQFVEMRLLFPRAMLRSTGGAKVVRGDGRAKIVAEERADAAEYERSRAKIDDALDHLPRSLLLFALLAFGPAALVLALAWLAFSRERRVAGYDREYEQEPPSDDPPALVGPLLRQSAAPGGAEFTATLFDLIRRGRYKAEPTTTEKWSWGALGKRPEADLLLSAGEGEDVATPLEQSVTTIIDRALESGPLPLSELAEKIAADRTSNAKTFTAWKSSVGKEFGRRRWYDDRAAWAIAAAAAVMTLLAVALIWIGAAGFEPRTARWHEVLQIALGVAAAVNAAALFGSLTSERLRRRWTGAAALEAARWGAFRRYLRDFPRLQEAPPASVALWERLLVTASPSAWPSGCCRRRRSPRPRSSRSGARSTPRATTRAVRTASTRARRWPACRAGSAARWPRPRAGRAEEAAGSPAGAEEAAEAGAEAPGRSRRAASAGRADARHAAARAPDELGGREREHRARGAGGRPQLAEGQQRLVDERLGGRRAPPVGRHPADREAGVPADERGVGLGDAERGLVDGVGAAAEDEHGVVAAPEHQRLDDLADLAPDRRGRVGRGARALGELADARERLGHAGADVGTRAASSSSVSG